MQKPLMNIIYVEFFVAIAQKKNWDTHKPEQRQQHEIVLFKWKVRKIWRNKLQMRVCAQAQSETENDTPFVSENEINAKRNHEPCVHSHRLRFELNVACWCSLIRFLVKLLCGVWSRGKKKRRPEIDRESECKKKMPTLKWQSILLRAEWSG